MHQMKRRERNLRDAFIIKYREDHTVEETAQKFHLSESQVKVITRKYRQQHGV